MNTTRRLFAMDYGRALELVEKFPIGCVFTPTATRPRDRFLGKYWMAVWQRDGSSKRAYIGTIQALDEVRAAQDFLRDALARELAEMPPSVQALVALRDRLFVEPPFRAKGRLDLLKLASSAPTDEPPSEQPKKNRRGVRITAAASPTSPPLLKGGNRR